MGSMVSPTANTQVSVNVQELILTLILQLFCLNISAQGVAQGAAAGQGKNKTFETFILLE